MNHLVLRPKNQVTLPREILEHLQVHTSDVIQYRFGPEGVILTSQKMTDAETARRAKLKRISQTRPFGFQQANEVEIHLNELRAN